MTTLTAPSPTARLRRAWLRLRSMRTAIILLLVLGAAASVGSFFPQRAIEPAEVADWLARNPGWAPLAEALSLFDVYGSWWFIAIYALLLVSLVGCLIPRYRAWFRGLRSVPRAEAGPPRDGFARSGFVDAAPEVVADAAERVLRARRYRVRRTDHEVAAEKGHWREGGSLLFHTSFLVLLVGVSLATLFGSTGQIAVIEGERFTDTRIEYDVVDQGRFFGGHSGVEVVLDEFDVAWYPNDVARYFRSDVRVFRDGEQVREASIFVNSPLTYGAVRFYQLSWGWAPVLRVTQGGRVLYDGATIFLPQGGGWQGVVKVPGTLDYQTGFEMLFVPSPSVSDDGEVFNAGPEPVEPLVVFEQFVGDLGLDVPQSVYRLDKTALTSAEVGAMRLGERAELPDDIAVEFLGLKQYSVFQVASNPGAAVLFAAAMLILVGLIPALYASRRRIWVRAVAEGRGARLEIAGRALQRKAAFAEESEAIVKDLDRELLARIGARHD